MPEFILVMPTGATNLYLERRPGSPLARVYFKLSVPRASLTNFLTLSGLFGEYLPIPLGTIPRQSLPLPYGLDARSALSWVSEVRHATDWDPGKGGTPLRMACFKTSAKSSPREQVFLIVWLDDSTSSQAMVYLEYYRLRKLR